MQILEQAQIFEELENHYNNISQTTLRELFTDNPQRAQNFSLTAADLFLDYSKNIITEKTMALLYCLAKEKNLTKKTSALINAEIVNSTEKRAALHIALRQQTNNPIYYNDTEIISEIRGVQKRMQSICEQIHNGSWLGFNGERITDIVNLGIGGSELGPALVTKTLKHLSKYNLQCHFVANIDATSIQKVLKKLRPQNTLFIISSKSFVTQETLQNALTAKQWLKNAAGMQNINKHFIAITANRDLAINWGIAKDNILQLWDWVGGRFSLWSAIGLPIALTLGYENFQQLLTGAYAMDLHFLTAPLENNMPVILALLSVWYIQFFNAQTHAILPYNQNLKLLPQYLQQAHMESLGKSRNLNGTAVDYHTGAIIWGGIGTQGQHTFHQLLHQGTHFIPVDFIIAAKSEHDLKNHHEILWANCLSQSQALMCGKNYQEVHEELIAAGLSDLEAKSLAPHKIIPGNRPSNTIVLKELNPFSLGALIALYEHKIFTQSVIWDINCFDQWGVELGKELVTGILQTIQNESSNNFDSSTAQLIEYFKRFN